MGSKAGRPHVIRFYSMLNWSPTGMNRLNSHFLRPSPAGSRAVSVDGQSAPIDKLGVSPSRSRLLTGPYCCHPGIVQQAQGRSAEMAISPPSQQPIYNLISVQSSLCCCKVHLLVVTVV
jgi:hypothetical protein